MVIHVALDVIGHIAKAQLELIDATLLDSGCRDFPDGYHGFWPKDLYEINEHFGGKSQLLDMLDTLHASDIKVMLDIVPNHMGYTQPMEDFSSLAAPFNDSKSVSARARACLHGLTMVQPCSS